MSLVKKGIATAFLSQAGVNAYWGIGWCPVFNAPKAVGNFQPEKYAGNWYEIRHDKDVWYQKDTSCVTVSYTYDPAWWKIYAIDVNNRSYDKEKDEISTTTWDNGDSYAWARCDDEGNCNVKFWWYPEGQYQVLDTDYTSFALVYGCDNWFGLFYTNQAWILSRTRTMSQS